MIGNILDYQTWTYKLCEKLAELGTVPEKERKVPYSKWYNNGVDPIVAAICIIGGQDPLDAGEKE